jgi:hypothetical protein
MKTLTLLAPDLAALDTIWRHPLPFPLWPVGHQPLLAHWMDEAVRTGVDEVVIYATDRPAEIRHLLEGGNYWSKKVTVHSLKGDELAPAEALRADHLPGQPAPAEPPKSAEELLAFWLELQKTWLRTRSAQAVSVDIEKEPGGWIGPLARVHPSAKLTPPYWIGTRAEIGAECEVGPHALVGEGSILDSQVQVAEAFVLGDTFLGRNTRLFQAVAQGGMLVDIRRACRVDIAETFIMAPVSVHREKASLADRAKALGVWLLLAPVALLWPGQKWEERQVLGRGGELVSLRTGKRGPLLIRRWPWLLRILGGQLLWIGLLPRGREDLQHVEAETAERLRQSPPGVFSWADLQGCHDSQEPDEWIHAAYQALQQDSTVKQLLRKKLLHLAKLDPPSAR